MTRCRMATQTRTAVSNSIVKPAYKKPVGPNLTHALSIAQNTLKNPKSIEKFPKVSSHDVENI